MDLKYDGVISVLPTPFEDDGRLDLGSLRRVIDLFIAGGVSGFTVLGVTGEVSRMTEAERALVLDTCIKYVDSRVPVVVGATTEGLHTCIEWCGLAKAAGAAAVMVSPPRSPRVNSDAVVNHFRTLAQQVDIPIIVQDYPPISGFFMEPALLVRIAQEVPNARVIKLEDAPTPLKTAQIRARAEGLEVAILGGLGGVYLLEELLAGGTGVMNGFPYPEMLVDVVRLFRSGKIEEAADSFYRYIPLIRFAFQQGIDVAIRKEMLRRRGVLKSAAIRAPGSVVEATTSLSLDYLINCMRRQGLPWV